MIALAIRNTNIIFIEIEKVDKIKKYKRKWIEEKIKVNVNNNITNLQ